MLLWLQSFTDVITENWDFQHLWNILEGKLYKGGDWGGGVNACRTRK